jgi:hypothetical protein
VEVGWVKESLIRLFGLLGESERVEMIKELGE